MIGDRSSVPHEEIVVLAQQLERTPQLKKVADSLRAIKGSPEETSKELKLRLSEIPPEILHKSPTQLKALREFLKQYPGASTQVDLGKHKVHLLLLQAECPTLGEALAYETPDEASKAQFGKLEDSLFQYFQEGEYDISKENVWELLELAHKHEITPMLEACRDFIVKNRDVLAQIPDNEIATKAQFAHMKKMGWLLLLLVDHCKKNQKPLPPLLQALDTLRRENPALISFNEDNEMIATVKSEKHLQALLASPIREDLFELRMRQAVKKKPADPKVLQLLSTNLQRFVSLKKIDLSGCQMNDESTSAIAHALKDNSSITEVNLGGNKMGEKGAESIAIALEHNSSIDTLNLGGNTIGEKGAESIARALKVNTSLISLDLYGCEIRAAGAQSIGKALQKNSSLQFLDLRNNYIQKGAEHIAQALKVNTTLSRLYLGSTSVVLNDLKPEEMRSIAEGLEKNTSLTFIDLSGNTMHSELIYVIDDVDTLVIDSAVQEIAHALEVNSTLREIRLNRNFIRDKQMERLAKSLQQNTSLTKVQLNGNEIGDQGAENLAKVLDSKSSSFTVHLEDNPIEKPGLDALKEASMKNENTDVIL